MKALAIHCLSGTCTICWWETSTVISEILRLSLFWLWAVMAVSGVAGHVGGSYWQFTFLTDLTSNSNSCHSMSPSKQSFPNAIQRLVKPFPAYTFQQHAPSCSTYFKPAMSTLRSPCTTSLWESASSWSQSLRTPLQSLLSSLLYI